MLGVFFSLNVSIVKNKSLILQLIKTTNFGLKIEKR